MFQELASEMVGKLRSLAGHEDESLEEHDQDYKITKDGNRKFYIETVIYQKRQIFQYFKDVFRLRFTDLTEFY